MERVAMGRRPRAQPSWEPCIGAVIHDNEEYGYLAVYMRLKGVILRPRAKTEVQISAATGCERLPEEQISRYGAGRCAPCNPRLDERRKRSR